MSRPSAAVTLAVALGLTASLLGGCTIGGNSRAASVEVPDLGHGYPQDVEEQLCAVGLVPRILDAPAIVDAGTNVNGYALLGASPKAGTRVPAGSIVELHFGQSDNAGGVDPNAPPESVVPDVVAQDVNAAIGSLTGLGFSVDVTTHTPANSSTVTTQDPVAGTTLAKGASVRLKAGPSSGAPCPTHS